jgi:putative hemolysin
MKDRFQGLIIAAILLLLVFTCLWLLLPLELLSGGQVNTTGRGIPDPAADYCISLNNSFEIRSGPGGTLAGVCVLPDGMVCDEGAFYRGRCPDAAGAGGALDDPVALFCLGQNYSYVIRENDAGTVDRLCVFPDGSECDALAYSLGACQGPAAHGP